MWQIYNSASGVCYGRNSCYGDSCLYIGASASPSNSNPELQSKIYGTVTAASSSSDLQYLRQHC